MRRSEWRAQETVCGYCRSCGGEIYMGEFCFRLNGRVFCRDCVRSAREIAGDTDVLPAPPQRKASPSIHRTLEGPMPSAAVRDDGALQMRLPLAGTHRPSPSPQQKGPSIGGAFPDSSFRQM